MVGGFGGAQRPRRSRSGRHDAERDGAEQRSFWATGRQLDAGAREVLDAARRS